ncbi:MAG: thiamine diphosphokinase [Candidatus Zixiibacteriota bacterium]|nr:MAG: thiamine diphosphokinase [candidate division Zixibacteria bacterium]
MRKKAKKKYILFLHCAYARGENVFYLKRLRGRITVAVDGGIRFFRKNGLTPDILIGDFDSAPRLPRKYLSAIEVLIYPTDKDKTDSQLALELALRRGASEIEICGAAGRSEIDHTIGNVMLLELVNQHNRKHGTSVAAQLISPRWLARLVENEKIELAGARGDYLSIIPLSRDCRVQYTGLQYPAPKGVLRTGDSLTLRNRFIANRVKLTVSGKAMVAVIFRGNNRRSLIQKLDKSDK